MENLMDEFALAGPVADVGRSQEFDTGIDPTLPPPPPAQRAARATG